MNIKEGNKKLKEQDEILTLEECLVLFLQQALKEMLPGAHTEESRSMLWSEGRKTNGIFWRPHAQTIVSSEIKYFGKLLTATSISHMQKTLHLSRIKLTEKRARSQWYYSTSISNRKDSHLHSCQNPIKDNEN